MEAYKDIEIKKSVFESNDREAEKLRAELKAEKTFLVNLMSSPGSGKTTTLRGIIGRLQQEMRIGVMEADIDSDVDAKTIAETGVRAIQLHTGGMCHLDAGMTRQGVENLGTADLDLVFLENVGNLVCPAEFDTGAAKNMMILSVPEGDDKPLKYPLMFTVSDVVLINKMDTKSVFDFDDQAVQERILKLNPQAKIFFISAKTGQRVDRLFEQIAYVYAQSTMRISTGMLNDVLAQATARVQPPTDKGRRLKIYYMTQASVCPPTFVFFVNNAQLFHFSYQRYLENQIREVFGLEGTPVRFIIRERGEGKK